MTIAGRPGFEEALAGFPEAARPRLGRLPRRRGCLDAADVAALCQTLNLSPQDLALALLPLAKSMARPEISAFSVGAVAVAEGTTETEGVALYLGANQEFRGLPLNHTIHAEQTAVVNAWHADTRHIRALAVSAPPCGACRQFLMEAVGKGGLAILLPSKDNGSRDTTLAALLPEAFGPGDLNRETGLFEGAHPDDCERDDPAPANPPDAMVRQARTAASSSYAPYTNHLAGCTIRLVGGEEITGRNLESAAFNPGLTALQSALALAGMTDAHLPADIERVVLAEYPTTAGQAAAAELLLSAWAPRAEFFTHLF